MTIEEAHAILERKQSVMTKIRWEYAEEEITANGLAILALEKAIPLKPLLVPYKDTEYKIHICPICGSSELKNYCDGCGQKLLWE